MHICSDAQALQEKQARRAAQKAAGGGEEDPRGKGGGTKNPGKAKVVKTMTAREASMKRPNSILTLLAPAITNRLPDIELLPLCLFLLTWARNGSSIQC